MGILVVCCLVLVAFARWRDSEADPSAAVDATNRFACDLFQKLATDKNVFFSPYSILSALAMTSEGARGQTAQEMEQALHLPLGDKARRESFVALYRQINANHEGYTLSAANALWVQKQFTLLPSYSGTVQTYYGGAARDLDFAADSEGARRTINQWVENQTRNKIQGLIQPGNLRADTRLVLTNAIYFKASWQVPFDKKETVQQPFSTGEGKTVPVKMMSHSASDSRFRYAEDAEVQVLELPYQNGEASALVFLPKTGHDLKAIENRLSPSFLAEWSKRLSLQQVRVFLPRFKMLESSILNQPLKEMGIKTAFETKADFSGITGQRNLWIGLVLHKAFADVNEEGTEAAAATTVVMTGMAMLAKVAVFRADHPFLFLIREKSGALLFMGKLADPSRLSAE
jgi:serpin B